MKEAKQRAAERTGTRVDVTRFKKKRINHTHKTHVRCLATRTSTAILHNTFRAIDLATFSYCNNETTLARTQISIPQAP